MSRYTLIKACRPVVEINKNKNILETEKFQNEVLRPILKFQNKLLIALFINTCKKSKCTRHHQLPNAPTRNVT